MANCSMCGSSIPDGQGVCSMCYGDPYFGGDGYYLAELERMERSKEDLKQIEKEMMEKFEEDGDANDLPF